MAYDTEEHWVHSFGKFLVNDRVPVRCLCEFRECRDKEGRGPPALKKVTVWDLKADALSWPWWSRPVNPATEEAESRMLRDQS